MVKRSEPTKEELSIIRKSEPVPFQTANGIATAEEVVDIFIPGLQETITCYVLDDTPNAIGLEGLCDDLGYEYVKKPGRQPYLRKNGLRHYCDTTQNVPIICPGVADERSEVSQEDIDAREEEWEFVDDGAQPAEAADTHLRQSTRLQF